MTFRRQRLQSASLISCLLWLWTTESILVNAQQTAAASAKKRLVFFAGPHNAGSSDVTLFFEKHYSAEAFDGWSWPDYLGKISDELGKEHHDTLFGRLVTNAENQALQTQILGHLRNNWENPSRSSSGMVIGTFEFDRVGTTPWSHMDGIDAMERVTAALVESDYPPDDVTVVLNYRAPRIHQWINTFLLEQTEVSHDLHYHRYVCAAPESNLWNHTWETLDTSMNQMFLASEYRKRGWKVVLIDTSGVVKAKGDMGHVVACDVLGVPCTQGTVNGIQPKQYVEPRPDDGFAGLDESGKATLEEIFRKRDCTYKQALQSDLKFSVLYQDTMWDDCTSFPSTMIDELRDTTSIFHAIRTLKGCHDGIHSELVPGSDGSFSISEKNVSDKEKKNALGKFKVSLAVIISLVMVVMFIKIYRRRNEKENDTMKFDAVQLSRLDAAYRIGQARQNIKYDGFDDEEYSMDALT